ncbi:hypothetical protein ACHAXA_011161 [Cyclostephanos tholiformis]|uniref:PUM-HD domain-containing protein n=1 Tax=Cyclostephanos tholiformis TaxID=382380 RepID=A0ABD3R4T5_9STRA
MGYNTYPSYHSHLSSAEESAASLGSECRSNRRRLSKKRGKEKKYAPTMALSGDFEESGSLLSIKVAKDQDGSRFIQQRLAVADELWNDVYGNFIVQKLLEFGTDGMKEGLAKRLRSETLSLSTRVYGCRVIQKALDELSNRDVASLISTFKGNVLLCLNDHNGNHVIQKSISILFKMAKESRENGEDDLCTLYLESIDPIVEEIIQSVELLAKHAYGCRAVQRMVEYAIEPLRSKVLDSIIASQDSLLCHTYGNYVVQKALEHGRPSDRDAIFKSITLDNSVIKFSKQKQASNVVEAMLRLGDDRQRQQIVQEMLNCFCVDHYNVTENAVLSMSKDPYANYVVKTALKVLQEGEQRDRLFSILLSHQADLEEVPFAKHIVAMLNTHRQSGEEDTAMVNVEDKK